MNTLTIIAIIIVGYASGAALIGLPIARETYRLFWLENPAQRDQRRLRILFPGWHYFEREKHSSPRQAAAAESEYGFHTQVHETKPHDPASLRTYLSASMLTWPFRLSMLVFNHVTLGALELGARAFRGASSALGRLALR